MNEPVFDRPVGKWTKAAGPKDYGYVRNILLVCPDVKRETEFGHYVNVPTEMFLALEGVLSKKDMKTYRALGAQFILYHDPDGTWAFYLTTTDSEVCVDDFKMLHLWTYTAKAVPGWMVVK